MSRLRISSSVVLIAVLALLLAASAGAAPQAGAAAPQDGPLVLAPVSSAIVFSPDVKVTSVNHETSVLTGAHVGKLIERRVLVGVGAYVLTSPRDSARMFYGGLVLGGRLFGNDRLNVGARSLFGVGRATLYDTFGPGDGGFERLIDRHGRAPHFLGRPGRSGVTDEFWIADPEVHLQYLLNNTVAFDAGAGYRVTSARRGLNEPLRGPTGSFGVRFNFE